MASQTRFIFVNGITKSVASWRQEDFIATVLEEKFANSCCEIYDPFDTAATDLADNGGFEQCAKDLLHRISSKRAQQDDRIIFLGHDLGGSLIKKALLLAAEDGSLKRIVDRTNALLFFGVLHRQNDTHTWESQLLKLLSLSEYETKRLFDCVRCIPRILDRLSEDFDEISGAFVMVNFFQQEINLSKQGISEFSATMSTQLAENIELRCQHKEFWDGQADSQHVQQYIGKIESLGKGELLCHKRQYHDFFRALIRLDPSTHRICNRVQTPESIAWIGKNVALKQWQEDEGFSVLHLCGPPGSGKYIVTNHILGLYQRIDAELEFLQLTFCFAERPTGRCPGLNFVLSLVRQVLHAQPQLFWYTGPHCQALLDHSSFSEENLWVLLRSLLRHSEASVISIVISNLCSSESSQIGIINELSALSAVVPGPIKVVLTAESHEWLTECDKVRHQVIELAKEPDMNATIEKAALARVKHLGVARSSWEGLHRENMERLTSPHPTYSWAMTKIKILEAVGTRSTKMAIQGHLQRTPELIAEYYHNVSETIHTGHHKWFKTCCYWAMFSVKPLTSRELATAVAFDEHGEDAVYSLDSCISWDIVGDINRFAGPLLQLVDGKVEVIHKDIKQYVASEQNGDASAHRILLSNCISYITLMYYSIHKRVQAADQNNTPVPDTIDCGFLNYACGNWPNHFNMARLDYTDSKTLGTVLEFLQNPDLIAFWAQEFLRYHPDSLDEASFRSPLLIACVFGLVCLVPDLLSSVDVENQELMSEVMCLTARYGHLEIARLLHKRTGKASREAFALAAEGGFVPLMDLFGDAWINEEDAEGNTPLLRAARKGHEDVVQWLLENGARPRATTRDQSTALHLVSRIGRTAIARNLLTHGIPANTSNSLGHNPIKYAAEGGFDDLIRLLIEEHGVRLEEPRGTTTALHLAAKYGHSSTCVILIDNGASIVATNAKSETPISVAVRSGSVSTVKAVLKDQLRNFSQEATLGMALHTAAAEGQAEVVRILLDEGAKAVLKSPCSDCSHRRIPAVRDVKAVEALARQMSIVVATGNVGTALTLAVVNQHSSVVKHLLRYAGSNAVRESRLLYTAAKNCDFMTLDILLRHADDMNPQQDYPLCEVVAAHQNVEQMLKLLFAAGADVWARNSSSETILFHVARQGLAEACRVLLQYTDGAGVNDKCDNQSTPFYLACYYQREEIVRILLPHAEVNVKCGRGYTPLHAATSYADIIRLLLSAGVDVNVQSDDGSTPVVFAAQEGNTECVRLLLEAGADCTTANNAGTTALHRAAQNGHIECVRLLVENGADSDREDSNGATPLHVAVSNGHEDVVTLLMDQGARVDIMSFASAVALVSALHKGDKSIADVFVRRAGGEGNTNWLRNESLWSSCGLDQFILRFLIERGVEHPTSEMLGPAVLSGDPDVVKLLLDGGVDINAPARPYGTALQAAVAEKEYEVFDFLLQRKADVNIQGGMFGSALVAAIHGRNVEMVKQLLEHGARTDTAIEGATPLLIAVKKGERNVVDCLLNHKADIKARTALGRCVLSQAIFWNERSMALHLLHKNVSIDDVDLAGRTPLMVAVMEGDTELVEALLHRGAQANIADVQGTTPLIMAVRGNKLEIVKRLLESGRADPTIPDCRERTALSWACRERNKTIFDLLKLTLSKYHGKYHDSLNHCSRALNAAAAVSFDNGVFEELVSIKNIHLARPDEDGWTPLYTCRSYQNLRQVEVLETAILLAGAYAELREPEIKKPSAWHAMDKSPCIKILDEGLTVELGDGPFRPFGTHEESAAVRADHCMPGHGKYYFEVTIEEDAYDKFVTVGFCEADARLDRLLGWGKDSWGYLGNDGSFLHGEAVKVSRPFQKGQTVGCGVNMDTEIAYYTLDGQPLGVAFQIVKRKLYPAVSFDIRSRGVRITTNFGQRSFMCTNWEQERHDKGATIPSSSMTNHYSGSDYNLDLDFDFWHIG